MTHPSNTPLKGKFDLIIVGGGPIGLAAAYFASKRNKKILVLEQDSLFHENSGSSGASRQFRIQYNDPKISKLVFDSLPLWEEIQHFTDEQLMIKCGSLWFGDIRAKGIEGGLATVTESLRLLNLPFELLKAPEIERRFHFSNLPPDWEGFFEPNGGSSNVKATLRALYKASLGKITLHEHEKVTAIESQSNGVMVKTTKDTYFSDKLILAPGPGINEVLKFLKVQLDLDLWQMDSAYFKLKNGTVDYPVWIDFQETEKEDRGLYFGFPKDNWGHLGYVRVAASYPSKIFKHLGEYQLKTDPKVLSNISNWVATHMKDLDPNPKFPSTCVCALFADRKNGMSLRHEMLLDFAVDSIPFHKNIVLCATGWAFKLVPLIGKICVELAFEGSTKSDISSFKFIPDMQQ